MLIFPRDPLVREQADPVFAEEAEAARELGIGYALIDHDQLVHGEPFALSGIEEGRSYVYRGWMVPSEAYAKLDIAMIRRGAAMRTTGRAFTVAHELPGWFRHFSGCTAETSWTTSSDTAGLVDIAAKMQGAAVLRDYVKSQKHYWLEACFVNDVHDTDHLLGVARRFRELQGNSFEGGYVLRSFEDYLDPEIRTWWIDGECVLKTPHPDHPMDIIPEVDVETLRSHALALGSPFITIDVAQRFDGEWRVIEVGDGQVSGRPWSQDPIEFIQLICGE